MKRQSRFSLNTIIKAIVVVSIISMVLTWETRETTSPIEQSVTYVIIPFQKGVTYFGDWVEDKVKFVRNIDKLESINEELEDEVNQLRYENKLLILDKMELDNLRELYELDKRYADYPKTGARVIGKDPSSVSVSK